MAFSFKKKSGSAADEAAVFEPQPDKARPWLEHARKAADPAYQLTCYAKAIAFDPTRLEQHQEMLKAAGAYMNAGGKPATGKEVKGLSDEDNVGTRFAAAQFEWMKDFQNFKASVKALDHAVKAGATEVGNWMADYVFKLMHGQKKVAKGVLVNLIDLFSDVNSWEHAMKVGERAKAMDPSDGELDERMKNLAAQRAMDQGGYTEAGGQEGGFRSMVKDADKQRELIEEETISGGSAEERNLARAKKAYEENPKDTDAINKLAQLLKRQATPESIKQAFKLYRTAHEATSEYRFKMAADDIVIADLEQKSDALAAKRTEAPDDAEIAEKADAARTKLLEAQSKVYAERVSKYPTDRLRKFDLGRVQFSLGNYEDAMAQFQSSKDEPKLQVRSGQLLGRCFHAEGWFAEAVGEYDEALNAADATMRDLELEIRYDLMVSLIALARDEKDSEAARRAKGICSEIARRDITYRDIRAKRKEVDEVIREIEG